MSSKYSATGKDSDAPDQTARKKIMLGIQAIQEEIEEDDKQDWES